MNKLLIIIASISCLVANEKLVISVVVPCDYKHFQYVGSLLTHYSKQTLLPDEVVISLSRSAELSEETIKKVENYSWPFRLLVIKNPKRKPSGANRNIAGVHASGELLIYQDADDIPHPQRVEIIKYFYEKYHFDHLIHSYQFSGNSFSLYQSPGQIFPYGHSAGRIMITAPIHAFPLHFGNCAIQKRVLDKIKWGLEYGEDWLFAQEVYRQFNNCIILQASLITYCSELTVYKTGWQ